MEALNKILTQTLIFVGMVGLALGCVVRSQNPVPKFKAGDSAKILSGFNSSATNFIIRGYRFGLCDDNPDHASVIYSGDASIDGGRDFTYLEVQECESNLQKI